MKIQKYCVCNQRHLFIGDWNLKVKPEPGIVQASKGGNVSNQRNAWLYGLWRGNVWRSKPKSIFPFGPLVWSCWIVLDEIWTTSNAWSNRIKHYQLFASLDWSKMFDAVSPLSSTSYLVTKQCLIVFGRQVVTSNDCNNFNFCCVLLTLDRAGGSSRSCFVSNGSHLLSWWSFGSQWNYIHLAWTDFTHH